MNSAPRLRCRLSEAAALVPASLTAVLACWSLSGLADPGSTIPTPIDQTSVTAARAPDPTAPGRRLLLRLPNALATVTLDDSSAARTFAAKLPLRLTLHDAWGQAKSGRLPFSMDIADAEPVLEPSVGELYYWAPSHTIAIYYDDLGQSVPPPGLVRLGVVRTGLTSINTAGNRFPVQIELGDRPVTLAAS